MPTVLSLDGMRVAIYPNDHGPAHVHVIGPGVEAVFDLRCPRGPPVLRESHGFRLAQANRVTQRLAAELDALCAHWRRIHGDD